jgi:hypothetical protein
MEAVQQPGTYVAVYYHPELVEGILLSRFRGLVGELYAPEDIHTTIIYADNNPFRPLSTRLGGQIVIARNPKYEILGEEDRCLTITFYSDVLHQRHEELRAMGLQHSYPEYKPHITLCENFDGDISALPRLPTLVLPIARETVEPIK